MDIDPFWTTGGVVYNYCFEFNSMAPSSKSPAAACKAIREPQTMLLFLGLLFIVPLLARPLDFPMKFMVSSPSTRTKQSTTVFHPKQAKDKPPFASTSPAAAGTTVTPKVTSVKSGSSSDQQFKAAAHEVPSGPNPESNK